MLPPLSAFQGLVAGILRPRRILFEDAARLPDGDEQHVRGHEATAYGRVFRLGDRSRADGEGREAFFEIVSEGAVILRITHRVFVARDGRVIPKLWTCEVSGVLAERFTDVESEVEDQRPVLGLVERVVGHIAA